MNLQLQRERIEWTDTREFGMDMYTLPYLKWITNKDLLYSLDGRDVWGRMDTHTMYGWVPLLSTWNYHNIINQLYPNTKYKA